jgi:hypothetical protein
MEDLTYDPSELIIWDTMNVRLAIAEPIIVYLFIWIFALW